MSRIILLKGQSNYGSLRLHIDQLGAAFNKIGYEAAIVDLTQSDDLNKLDKLINEPIDFFFAFNGMGIDLTVGTEKQSLYDVLDVPFVAALVDHPHMHLQRLVTKMKHLYVTSLDEGHLKFTESYFLANHIKGQLLFPPGGNRNLEESIPQHSKEQFLQERDIDFLFTGSFRGIPSRTWTNYPKSLSGILDDVAEIILSKDTMSFEEGLAYILKERNIQLSSLHWKKMQRLMGQVNVYVHSMRRYTILDTLAKADIQIQIYGQGWDSMKDKWKSFSFKEEGTFAQTLDLLRRTKLVLNSNTHFVNGAHERVFSAMVNGAAVISDISTYYENHFTHKKDILLYKWSEIEKAPEIISYYLNHSESLYEIAKAGQENALANHTWEKRAQQLVDFMEMNLILTKNVQEI